ncbi:hypothetical protein [Tychonema sp. LEGE 07203]|uniref:hypothetical protein n=1 Tax=Tychonema sp. LEGE 07203 TaxID=1828671 RepID=UPI001882C507|nr:hypothetical protein [Tychonema sp. LEGE 07203]MBE9092657.1 hypothetical protein [Tychonema sp. LEGE 07203]
MPLVAYHCAIVLFDKKFIRPQQVYIYVRAFGLTRGSETGGKIDENTRVAARISAKKPGCFGYKCVNAVYF